MECSILTIRYKQMDSRKMEIKKRTLPETLSLQSSRANKDWPAQRKTKNPKNLKL